MIQHDTGDVKVKQTHSIFFGACFLTPVPKHPPQVLLGPNDVDDDDDDGDDALASLPP